MSEPLTTRRPDVMGRRAVRGSEARARPCTILVAGVVPSVDRLQELAQIERVRLRGVVSLAERAGADVVVIGATAPPSLALEVIGELKRHPRTAPIPAIHLVAAGAACGACGAEICLPGDAAAATLLGVARMLLRVRSAEAARAPADAAPDRDGLVAAASTAERLIALGRLAGGVVHDFNNLLLVMVGHVELARRLIGEGHPAAARLATVLHAVERAAALNRQLLAFGRPALSPEPLTDLDAVTTQLAPMLRRLLGEYVRLELRAGSARGLVQADATQVEQLLLNLVLNARDAMPGGGRLSVETQDVQIVGGSEPPVPPGRYVVLSVSDEGVGIDPAAREHLFEPFFTTKPVGDGAGLGLATVRRVAQQAGGHVSVDSEPGLGTTFRVYLPRAGERREAAPLRSAAPAPTGCETVLVADGSEPARAVTRELLEGLGYAVLTASCAEEALRLARELRDPIDVVLADAAMPGLRGGRLAEQLAAARPRTRVLLMSPDGAGGVAKPFSREGLARAVRDALDVRRG